MPAPKAFAMSYRALEQDYRLLTRPASDVIAWHQSQPVTCGALLADIRECAKSLPDSTYLINLCADRYRFNVAFFAAAINGQTTLLPSQRTIESIAALREAYHPCQIIADNPDTHCDSFVDFTPLQNGDGEELSIKPEHVAAIAFTSGSTGKPSAHLKTWALLCAGRATHARYLQQSEDLPENKPTNSRTNRGAQNTAALNGLVSTVPSWHMYGLEWAMLLPTVAPLTLFCGADFFPGDVVTALNNFGRIGKNILVSTPVHLRALLKSPAPANPVARTLCATAPLDANTAAEIESHLSTRMFEIYGCSEIGSLACRKPREQTQWNFFDIFELQLKEGQLEVSTPLLPTPVTLADRFGPGQKDGEEHGNENEDLNSHRSLMLLGRATDLVKVAGKRESLARLNNELLALPGVTDGVMYQPEALGIDGGERLGAFAVGDQLDVAAIRTALANRLDPAFVPRPIRIVNELPRDATSKLKMSALKELIESFRTE